MEDLIQKLMDRVNLDRQRAEEVVNTVKSFVQERLPDPIAEQVERALEGSSDAVENLKGLAGKLPGVGGLLGDKGDS